MLVVEIKIVYFYYLIERVILIFLNEEELLGLNYDVLKWKIVNEILYLSKIMNMVMLWFNVLDGGY